MQMICILPDNSEVVVGQESALDDIQFLHELYDGIKKHLAIIYVFLHGKVDVVIGTYRTDWYELFCYPAYLDDSLWAIL